MPLILDKEHLLWYLCLRINSTIDLLFIMKSIVLLLLFASHFSFAQSTLVYIPVSKTDKINNVANGGFSSTYQYFAPEYKEDQFGTDSSALVLGMRRYFEMAKPLTLVEVRYSELRFSICFKLDTLTLSKTWSLKDRSALLLGEEYWGKREGIGIYYDYQDSTVGTFNKSVSFKTGEWQKWHKVELVYGKKIVLWVDGQKVDSAASSMPDYSISTSNLGCGTYGIDYFYGLVDEIKVTGSVVQALSLENLEMEEKQLRKATYYNLQGQKVFVWQSGTAPFQERGIYVLRKEFSDGSQQSSKVFLANGY